MPETRYAGPTRQEQRNNSAAESHVAIAASCPSAWRTPSSRIMSCDAGCIHVEAASPLHGRKTSIGAGPAISPALQVASDLVIALTAALKV